ncbi:glucosyltransferase [Pichia californica]|uniref:Dol-P-Glc:Glc(2)Man(9)GlcNAc(2)-PP-Dol alpha-1,2-glucosyltransferase n=1 Tax=Pichia californica TaxID=460514 RepID=A0A9P6WQ93_9ASCO|nr:glucosyltransferase [[Candida] californica]KAG0691105.1 glucosyltransferase [[Candida] californica]
MSLSESLLDIAVAGIASLPVKQFVEDVAIQVNYPFIDEIFHYPQFKKIFRGDYKSWNPKITTPPGLYYLTLIYTKIFKIECTLENMRFFNYIGGLFLIAMIILIRLKSQNPGFTTAAIFLNPLLSVFYSLFYTDVWASAIVVAAYAVIVYKPFGNYFLTSVLSASIGLISLTFRQTNIIWCVFLLAALIDSKVKDEDLYKYEEGIEDPLTFIKTAFKNIVICIPYIIVGLIFVGFVYMNGGIALGDKENHILVPHLAQLCYCMTFIAVFTAPLWFSFSIFFDYLDDNFFCINGLVFNLAWIPSLFIFIQSFTIIHPFILADNRHFTFYIVRNFIIRTETSKYELLPIYHFSFYIVHKIFMQNCNVVKGKNNNFKRTAASPIMYYIYMICTFGVVCLSPLFEPRYYILPYIFFRLFTRPNDQPVIEFWLLKIHNTKIRYIGEILWLWFWTQALYLVFLQFTFEWENIAELQRVIW